MLLTSLRIPFLMIFGLCNILIAHENLFSYQIGYTSNTTYTTNRTEEKVGGFYNGVDLMGTSSSGLGAGIGFDMNIWNPKTPDSISEGTSIYTMGISTKLGYTFQNHYNIPLKLKAGIGYGLMDSMDHDGWGIQYEAGAEYLLYKNLGIGIKYKYAQADMLSTTIKNDSVVYYIMLGH